MTFHKNLSDSLSPQFSWTLLSILVDLNNLVVWMVSTRPLIFKSPNPSINPFVDRIKAPITTGIIITFMFQYFQFPSKVQELLFLFTFLQIYSGQQGQQSPQFCKLFVFFFFSFLFIIRSVCQAEIR